MLSFTLEPNTSSPPDGPLEICVDLGERSYQIIVENGALKNAGTLINKLGIQPKKIAIITDSNVGDLHAKTLIDSLLSESFETSLHTIPAGEASKSFASVDSICREMTQQGHDRKSLIIALGGGVVGDLAGFIASIFFRGIPFIQIPTTIVAQVDSSVGGKTGINIAEGKNLIGAFHQPALVIVDPQTLLTLPPREFREGFAEAIKHAAIRQPSMLGDILAFDSGNLHVSEDFIFANISIKARIVEDDEHETLGIRAFLNLGHTIGHGIEASLPYGEILHGEAISYGLRAALYLSVKHANLSIQDAQQVLSALHHYQLPLVLPNNIATDTVMQKLQTDKKFYSGKIRFVLLRKLGQPELVSNLTAEDLHEAIEHIRTPILSI